MKKKNHTDTYHNLKEEHYEYIVRLWYVFKVSQNVLGGIIKKLNCKNFVTKN